MLDENSDLCERFKNTVCVEDLCSITDFDLGVGDTLSNFVRVSSHDLKGYSYKESELNLITWLLLEKELKKSNQQHDELESFDSTDASKSSISNKLNTQARKYAERLLRAVGVSVPFELLSSTQREELFILFSSQSNLLRSENCCSILSLYEALRRRSKIREEFKQLKILGRGKFGSVSSAMNSTAENKQIEVAIKTVEISSFESLDSLKMILNEATILKNLHSHPNIVQHYDSWIEVSETDSENLVFYLSMELCHISLNEWKTLLHQNNKEIEKSTLSQITSQLLEGLQWIHEHNCMHLDINPKNILWSCDKYEVVKIADFGLAVPRVVNKGRYGTVPYCAPETTLVPKSDVYSLGITLFEISQQFSTRSELYKRIELKDFRTMFNLLDEILPLMLNEEVEKRSSASEILKSIMLNMQ